jgi:uncharacterized protein YecE (DUF72 family)
LANAYVGISGYIYKNWRGAFYPEKMAQREWLAYASRVFNSIELNGTFYSLKSPAVFEKWASEVPDDGFVFAIKGSRFITHNLKLRNIDVAMGNFLASGILALGEKTGPFLWQLPDTYRFDRDRIEGFLRALPRDTRAAARLARKHDERLKRGALVKPAVNVPLRHAMEVRHDSYDTPEFYDLLRAHDVAYVIADTAGRWTYAEEVTSNFVYVRLHGSQQLYVSGYTDEELDRWAAKCRGWMQRGCDVYVYFDNDAKVHAPNDAKRLAARLGRGSRG